MSQLLSAPAPASDLGRAHRADPAPSALFTVRALPRWATVLYAVLAAVASGTAAVLLGLPLGALLAVALAAGYALVVRPTLLTVLAVALVPVTAGVARGVPVPGLRVSEVLIVVTAVVVLGFGGLEAGPRWTTVDWLALIYVGLGLVLGVVTVVLVRGESFTQQQLQIMFGPVQFFLLYRCAATQLRRSRDRRIAIAAVLAASVPVSLFAIAQSIGPPIFQQLAVRLTSTTVFETRGFVPLGRATSVFPNWHSLAAYLLLIVLLCAALLLDQRWGTTAAVGLVTVTVLGVSALAATLTVTAVVLLIAGVIGLGLWYRKTHLVAAAFTVGAVAAAFSVGPRLLGRVGGGDDDGTWVPQTLAYRWEIWTGQYLPILDRYLSVGYGPDLPEGPQWQHTESGYLLLLLRGGLPLLASLVALVVAVFLLARQVSRVTRGPERALARMVAVVCLLVPVGSIVFPYLTASGMPQLLFPLWGMLVAGVTLTPAEERALSRVT